MKYTSSIILVKQIIETDFFYRFVSTEDTTYVIKRGHLDQAEKEDAVMQHIGQIIQAKSLYSTVKEFPFKCGWSLYHQKRLTTGNKQFKQS